MAGEKTGATEHARKDDSQDGKNLLHNGVMGVLTGLTRTLSWVIYCDGRQVSDASAACGHGVVVAR